MNKVKNGHLVSINYVVKNKENDEIIDSNNDKEKPLVFLLGKNQVISGLEKAIIEKEIGSSFSIEISPEDAYGIRNPDFLQEVPKEQFEGIELKKGMTLFGQSDNGESAQVIVYEIGKDNVIIDFNHPLAGKTLIFDVKILSSKEPTDDEIIKHSSIYNNDCCCNGKHESGNCCGKHHH